MAYGIISQRLKVKFSISKIILKTYRIQIYLGGVCSKMMKSRIIELKKYSNVIIYGRDYFEKSAQSLVTLKLT